MERAHIAALLATAYLVGAFVWHRLRVARARRRGPTSELLGRFDYRALGEELLAGEAGPSDRAAVPAQANAPRESGSLERQWIRLAFERLEAGDLDAAEAASLHADATARPVLACAIGLRRLELGSAQGAAEPDAARTLLATVDRLARRHPSAALEYLAVHVSLRWLTHAANLEWAGASSARRLRRAIRTWGDLPFLHFALAHAHAVVGRTEECVEELGRALYQAQGDAFYARAVVDRGFVARAQPALLSRCRALCAARASGQGASGLPPFPGES